MKRATVQLGDFLTLKRGYDLPKHVRVPGGVPVVSSSGISGTHKEAKVDGPGVVTGRYGTLGKIFYIDEPFWPLNTALYVQDFKGNHPRFVSYFLKWILNGTQSDKAAVPGVNRNDLHARKVKIPDNLSEQKAIAFVLSAYDNLIENNRRRIQLLEQSARLLYKEWFVNLRFPGHEHIKIIDSVPEGWEKIPFVFLADFLNGFAFKPSDWAESGIPIVKIPELRDGPTIKTPKNSGDNIPEKYLLQDGDILFSWSGTLLVNIWNHGKGLLNQHLFKVMPVSPELRSFVYLALKEALNEFLNETTGATMKHIRKRALQKVAPIVPVKSILREFESVSAPIIEQIGILQRQITQASKARDLLLPKLMSGEVAV